MSYDDEDAYSVNGGEEPAPFSGNGNEMESEFVDEAFDRVAGKNKIRLFFRLFRYTSKDYKLFAPLQNPLRMK